MFLAAFFVRMSLPAGAGRPEILHFHFECRADARQGVGEGADQRAVAQIAYRSRMVFDWLITGQVLPTNRRRSTSLLGTAALKRKGGVFARVAPAFGHTSSSIRSGTTPGRS